MKSGSFPTLWISHQDAWAPLRRVAQWRFFQDKEMLYQAGSPAHELYLLETGRVRLFSHSARGRNLTLSVVEPGDIFGELALFPHKHQASQAQALSAGALYAIPRRQLEPFLGSDPSLILHIMENLGRRLQAVERRLGDLVFKSVPDRLAALLLDLAGPVTGQSHGPARLPDHYTHSQLAEMINTHRETVTKTLNRFQDDRLLEFDRRWIVLLDMPRLREMAMR
jgi:CRP-like cAMP-binding protein